jgi:hypothetical protein
MSDEELAKDLGPLAALTVGVGTMIGAGIFVLPGNLPCDFLVFRDRGFDPSELLVPTAGGPDSDLSAETRVGTGDVGTAIRTAARDATVVLVGATERGLVSRLTSTSVPGGVIEGIDCSVLLAEKAHKRSLRERLFGS